jgi:hypothetical protein
VSWMHAGMWLVPALGLLIDDGRRRGRLLLGLGVVALLNVLTPHPPDPTSGPIALRAWHEVLVVVYVAFVAALPVRRSTYDVPPGRRGRGRLAFSGARSAAGRQPLAQP